MTTWVVGGGDIGRRVAAALAEQGDAVVVVSRSAASLSDPAVDWRQLDLDQAVPAQDCRGARMLYTVPPSPVGHEDVRLSRWLTACATDPPAALVYISTSGVYGDCGGDWVDETRPPRPQTDRARRRLAAEGLIEAFGRHPGCRTAILRVPGIYGPGRLPERRLRERRPLVRPDQAPWSNRIHADDLARVCRLALERGRGLYNVADGQPSSMSDYFLRCARVLGLPEPAWIDHDEAARHYTPAMLSYLHESRRLDTRRLREDLGFVPSYPDLDSGLRASLAGQASGSPAR